MTDAELLAGVLRKFVTAEWTPPYVILCDDWLLVDGTIGITDEERAALTRIGFKDTTYRGSR